MKEDIKPEIGVLAEKLMVAITHLSTVLDQVITLTEEADRIRNLISEINQKLFELSK